MSGFRHPRPTATLAAVLVAGLTACATPSQPSATTPQPVARVDIGLYLGTWHEIAKYPNRFQAQCVGDSTATYSTRDDGRVRVVNRCRLADGGHDQAEAVARPVEGSNGARLQVRFAPWWLGWLPGIWADYWIIDLDSDYSLAAISEPTRQYLWVLSRTPKVAPAAYDALLARLRAQGFDTKSLKSTPE